ncbi:hypothetical protein FAIPA1_270020 [Frankia sp. AiPs1]|uniref:hypothetical protein n=1 Tax=Frankia sp. AiPa1 TaxID=573492 RepID=UPI00202B5DE9|nr:hypothetical protein [Frankia sp. AiPa1]MCL9762171.1 hypothetical protein [Frankia sp. AiPa1]
MRIFRAADPDPTGDVPTRTADSDGIGPASPAHAVGAGGGDSVRPDGITRSDGEGLAGAGGDEIVRLEAYFRAMREDLGARLLAAEAEIRELRGRVTELERARDRPAATAAVTRASTVRHDEYRAIANRVEGLLDQQITYLATGGRRATSATALVARRFAGVLFADSVADSSTLRALLHHIVTAGPADPGRPGVPLAPHVLAGPGVDAADAADVDPDALNAAVDAGLEITRLRAAAVEGGLTHHWVFDADLGEPVDDTRQRTFGLCDPDHPVTLVVFPAFVVDDAVMMRQRVHTAPPPSDRQPPDKLPTHDPLPTHRTSADPPPFDPISVDSAR